MATRDHSRKEVDGTPLFPISIYSILHCRYSSLLCNTSHLSRTPTMTRTFTVSFFMWWGRVGAAVGGYIEAIVTLQFRSLEYFESFSFQPLLGPQVLYETNLLVRYMPELSSATRLPILYERGSYQRSLGVWWRLPGSELQPVCSTQLNGVTRVQIQVRFRVHIYSVSTY